MDDTLYALAFSYAYGIGPARVMHLETTFGSLEQAYHAPLEELLPILGEKTTHAFDTFRNTFDAHQTRDELEQKHIIVLSKNSPQYPKRLQEQPNHPTCLYCMGTIDALHTVYSIGIVGTRTPTPYGKQVTYMFASQLAEAGVTIVSGLARGVDAIAHQSTLDAYGSTIAVLGCTIDTIYPQENTKLHAAILRNNGIIISPYPPGTVTKQGMFVARNAIIAGLSQGVLVTEGSDSSGALTTARVAHKHHKPVFACPAPITHTLSQAPNSLLKQGAIMVTSPQDILDHLNINTKSEQTLLEKSSTKQPSVAPPPPNLSPIQQHIYTLIQNTPQSVDDISRALDQPVTEVLSHLTILELQGIVSRTPEGLISV